MIYWNTNQEESNVALDQLYTLLADILISQEGESTDERNIS